MIGWVRLLTALVAGTVFGDVPRGGRFRGRHPFDCGGRKRHENGVDDKIRPGRGRKTVLGSIERGAAAGANEAASTFHACPV